MTRADDCSVSNPILAAPPGCVVPSRLWRSSSSATPFATPSTSA